MLHPSKGGPARRLAPPVGQFWSRAPSAARLSADGRWAAFSFGLDDYWELWDRTAPREPRVIVGPRRYPDWPSVGEFTPDGTRFVTLMRDRQLVVYDPATGAPVAPVPAAYATHLRWLDGGQLVGITNCAVSRWEPLAGRLSSWTPLPPDLHGERMHESELSYDGATVAYLARGYKTVAFDPRTGGRRVLADFHHSAALLLVSPDGTLKALNGEGGVRVTNARTGAIVCPPKADRAWYGCAFTPDGRHLLVGSEEHGLAMWDTTTWGSVPLADSVLHKIEHFAFGPNGIVVAVIEYWATPPRTETDFFYEGRSVHTLTLLAWDATTGRQLCKVPLGRVPYWAKDPRTKEDAQALRNVRPTVVAALADCRTVAVGCWEGCVFLIDTATGRVVRTFGPTVPVGPDSTPVLALAPSPCGRYLASGSHAGIFIWDVRPAPGTPQR
ncbi:MAG: WD40 repeat domain-containing protein [Planctomycetes bacterium]|nr:WD40 repeat domain-containing protein [Planctomycetota bacterium]